jgi:hypothetical protein
MAVERPEAIVPTALTRDDRDGEERSLPSVRRLLGGGTSGNELLTSATGAVLIVLLAVIGVTIIRIGQLLWVHLFVGMLLIGPLALKLASTGYRFVRYYTHDASYVRKGPPTTPLRLLAPLVVLSTLVVFGSGVALLFAGPSSRAALFPIHKLSFFAWVGLMAVHVLAHLPQVVRALRDEHGAAYRNAEHWSGERNGRAGRTLSLGAALISGGVLAVLVIPQFGPWLSTHLNHH